MIPQFPEFKKVELNDREAVEAHTSKYPPYSDFNFTSLWAWDTSGQRMISELNENLVVRFTDYKTNEPFLSFLGSNEEEETARKLIEYAKSQNITPELRLVPEDSVKGMQSSSLRIEEDRDNFDYVYQVSELALLEGSRFKERRKLARKFERECGDVHFIFQDLMRVESQERITQLFERWGSNKKIQNKMHDSEHEEHSLKRLLQIKDTHVLWASQLVHKDSLIGFSVSEILPNAYSMSHFAKADSNYSGVYEFMNMKEARCLTEQGVAFWDWEQDLGFENLRKSKMSYCPSTMLKKYRVCPM
jgi:hypothetical protein